MKHPAPHRECAIRYASVQVEFLRKHISIENTLRVRSSATACPKHRGHCVNSSRAGRYARDHCEISHGSQPVIRDICQVSILGSTYRQVQLHRAGQVHILLRLPATRSRYRSLRPPAGYRRKSDSCSTLDYRPGNGIPTRSRFVRASGTITLLASHKRQNPKGSLRKRLAIRSNR